MIYGFEPSFLFYASTAFIAMLWFASWTMLASSLLFDKIPLKHCAFFSVCASIVHVSTNHIWLYFPDLIASPYTNIWQSLLYGLPMVFLYRHVRRLPFLQIVSAVCLSFFLFQVCLFFVTTNIFVTVSPWISEYFVQPYFSYFAESFCYAMSFLIAIALSVFLRKVHFPKYWASLFSTTPRKITTTALCLLLMYLHMVILLVEPSLEMSTAYSLFSLALMISVILAVLFIAMYNANKDTLQAQQSAALQQRAYMQTLESIQNEVRGFRHDYHNMMAGLYLQAQQGDVEGLQDQLRKKLEYFDESLSEHIRQTSALVNIDNIQVKSLLAVKAKELQDKSISFHIEIVRPVKNLGMDVEDFGRTLGILIDNAAEAAAEAEKPLVDLIMVSKNNTFHVIVRNTFSGEAPALNEVWIDGFSTKGSNRGIGLTSLKRLLGRYENTTSHTSISEHCFTQELIIDLGGAQ